MCGESFDGGRKCRRPAERIETAVPDDIERGDDQAGATHDVADRRGMRLENGNAGQARPDLVAMDLHALEAQLLDRGCGNLDVVAAGHQRHADELAVIGLHAGHRCAPPSRCATCVRRSPICAMRWSLMRLDGPESPIAPTRLPPMRAGTATQLPPSAVSSRSMA